MFDEYAALEPARMDYHGWEIAARFRSVEEEYQALHGGAGAGAGVIDLSHRGKLAVRGEDAPRFLHGMVTNEVQELEIGHGNYTFVLDPKGHILADARVLRLGAESYLIDCEPHLLEVIRKQLDDHIIADAVELEDQSAQLACVAVEGPSAAEVIQRCVGVDVPVNISEMGAFEHLWFADSQIRLVRASASGADGYLVLASPEKAAGFWRRIPGLATEAQRAQRDLNQTSETEVCPVGFEALEIRRIEQGTPRYGVDMDAKTLPQETGQMHAISFTKGCYIGQETVERIHSRGHVNRQLVGLRFPEQCEMGREMMVLVKGHPSGFTTSVACLPGLGPGLARTIALAYLRREAAEPGTVVQVNNQDGEVAELPFG